MVSFDIRSIDVVADRNNIRKLLSFISPSMAGNWLEAFITNIEATENTVVFCRNEAATHEFISLDEFKGYDHEFEIAYTNTHIRASIRHRIISYRFSGLNFIVRHETDGYISTDTKTPSSDTKGLESDSLSSILGSLTLSWLTALLLRRLAPKLTIQEEGHMISLKSTLELKMGVFHEHIEIHEVAPQLWASQTPRLVRAYHHRGTFSVPEVEDVAADIKTGEEGN